MDDKAFRRAMGKFATGVTVITTCLQGEVHGMTANAFVSVSLDPRLILVSISKNAKMLETMKESGAFAVSVLSQEQKEMSVYFAGQAQERREIEFTWVNDMPVLPNSLAALVCDVYDAHAAGDHTLFIGKVNHITTHELEPLLFFGGNYRMLQASSL